MLLSIPLATSALAARPITFEVFIGDFCIAGRARNNSFLKVIIRDAQGRQKGREAVEADPYGYWQSCVFIGARSMAPGDRVSVTDFKTGAKRTLTVPLLTAKIDRGTNVVSGKAPAGATIQLEAFDFRWDFWGDSYDVVHDVVAKGGRYKHDFDTDGIDLKGGARVVVAWRNGGDTVRVGRFQMAPFVVMAIGTSEIAGASGPNKAIKVKLSKPKTTRVATANGVGSYADTIFYSEFARANGEPYVLRGGEWLEAAALGAKSAWRVPAINGTADRATDSVSGTCFSNGRYMVTVQDPNGFEYALDAGTAAADGRFTIDLSSQIDIRRNFYAAILCYSPEGDELTQEFTT